MNSVLSTSNYEREYKIIKSTQIIKKKIYDFGM